MLQINLLPLEKRKPERTPIPRFALILALTAATVGIAFYVVFLFIEISNLSKTIVEKNLRYADVVKQVADFPTLQAEASAAQSTWTQIEQVAVRPMRWSLAIRALVDVIVKNPRIWIENITMLDAGTARSMRASQVPGDRGAAGGGIVIRCGAAGNNTSVMTKFRNDLKTDPALKAYFDRINVSPDWTITTEDGYEERHSIPFTVTLFAPPQPKTVIQAN